MPTGVGRFIPFRAIQFIEQTWEGLDLGRLLPLLILLLLVAAISAKNPSFLSIQAAYSVAIQAAPVVILAAGLTPVFILGGIDLSVAALSSLSTVLLAIWMPKFGFGGVCMVLGFAALCGAFVGLVQSVTQISSFVTSLGALGVYSGMALQVSKATNEPLGDSFSALYWISDSYFGLPASLFVALGFAALIALGLRYLSLGQHVYATGASERAALLSGIRTGYVRVCVFAVSGLAAGLAGIVLVARTAYSSPTLADNFLLPSIAAVVVGGTAVSGGLGGISRSVVGALIVTVVTIGMVVVGIDPVLQNVVFGVAIIAAVALTIDRRKLVSIK